MTPPNELSTVVAPEDDWRIMSDFADKRRAQNRLAQRNYRRNMKQRIRDLEEQLATQTSMLAVLGTPEGKPIDWQSRTPKASQENLETQTSSAFLIAQESLRTPFSEESGMFWSPSRDLQAQAEVILQGDPDEQTVIEPSRAAANQFDQTIEREGRQKSRKDFHQQSSGDWTIDNYEEANFLEQVGRVESSAGSARGARAASSSSWSEYAGGAHRSSLGCTGDRLTATATLQQRIEFLLKCSEDAGFKDFDTAIRHYYTAKPDGPVWSAARESSDRHGLSELLKEICAGGPNWAGDQAHRCKDHILHSAEEVLLSELRVFADSDGPDFIDALKSYGSRSQSIDWRHMASIIQIKLPNIWLFVSAMLHKSMMVHGPRMQAQLTAYIISMMYIVDTSSAAECHGFLDKRI
ncbi:transcription factor bZIP [Seiridium cupressi]